MLHGVDLSVARGEVVALMGPSGSGKSTLLRALAGLEPPTAGRVELAGIDVTAEPAEARFPRLALVVQDPARHLLTEHVRDEVGFGLTDAAPRVEAALAALDLTAHAPRHPRDLSVGERERVVLAAALAAEPDVLLLDEPTRGMDPARRGELAALLRGRTAVVATHDPAFAAAAADRVVHLDAGRIVPLAPARDHGGGARPMTLSSAVALGGLALLLFGLLAYERGGAADRARSPSSPRSPPPPRPVACCSSRSPRRSRSPRSRSSPASRSGRAPAPPSGPPPPSSPTRSSARARGRRGRC